MERTDQKVRLQPQQFRKSSAPGPGSAPPAGQAGRHGFPLSPSGRRRGPDAKARSGREIRTPRRGPSCRVRATLGGKGGDWRPVSSTGEVNFPGRRRSRAISAMSCCRCSLTSPGSGESVILLIVVPDSALAGRAKNVTSNVLTWM